MAVQRRFSVEFKTVAVARLELGESAIALAAEFGFHRSLIYRWREAQRAGRLGQDMTARSLPADQDRKPTAAQMASVRVAARGHAEKALQALAAIMKNGNSEASRIAAANAILDRAHGKPGQPAEAKPRSKAALKRIERVIVRPQNRDG